MLPEKMIGRFTSCIASILLLGSAESFSNNLAITSPSVESVNPSGQVATLQFSLSWENSWRDEVNYDAVWVFVKFSDDGGPWGHASLIESDGNPSSVEVEVSPDGLGAFVFRSTEASGNFQVSNLLIDWDYGASGITDITGYDIVVYGIEMVSIPEGSFLVGDGENSELYGNFENGTSGNPLQITSEGALTLGGGAAGSLGNNNRTGHYVEAGSCEGSGCVAGSGDDFSDAVLQSLPGGFPKGFQAFYCMKYELTQQQWVDMLNTCTAQQLGVLTSTSHYYMAAGSGDLATDRYGISEGGGVYSTTQPHLPMIYLDWIRGAAYGDWAGLRPMTELEFEKTCRGPEAATAGQYPWGNSAIALSGNLTVVNAGDPDESIATGYNEDGVNGNCWIRGGDRVMTTIARVGIFASQAENSGRITSGSTFYGVMDMGGNAWERTVSVGHANGREFQGNHGDGALNVNGYANVADWPGDPFDAGYIETNIAIGYRGGGLAFPSPNTERNARISSRRLASAYYNLVIHDDGIRFVRTAQ